MATFTCDTGYNLVGESTRTCKADGTWDGSQPTCEARQCPALTNPTGGYAIGSESYVYLAEVTFWCSLGYNLVGDTKLTCQADGTWSGNQPTCEAIQCPVPTIPANSIVDGPESLAYGDVITFVCNDGYHLTGDSTRTCQADGTWSGNPPTCGVVQCPLITTPAHASMDGGNSYQDVVTFTCHVGYYLVGAGNVRCQYPTGLLHGTMSGGNFYQDVVTFTCKTGHELQGAPTTTCQADFTWSNAVPTCPVIQCPRLEAPANGAMTGDNSYQDSVQFTCDSGYDLVGARSTTCQADRSWSVSVPTCTRVKCPLLTNPAHGSKSGNNLYQDVVQFSCDLGYELVGAATTTCQATATWSNSIPTCTRVQCPYLTAPTHGSMTGSNFYQDRMEFTCYAGYDLVGVRDVTCQADRTWSDEVPTCTPVQCPSLSPLVNGGYTGGGTNSYGDVADYQCDTGFHLLGSSVRACLADRTWNVNECNSANGGCGHTCTNTIGSFQCSCGIGYSLNDDGFSCDAIECPSLTAPLNGTLTGNNFYQDEAQFTCDSGYNLVGKTRITCQADGTWSGSVPTCLLVHCSPLRAPVDGTMTGSFSYQDVVEFTCNSGYNLEGSPTTECQADGTWTDIAPTCTSVRCQLPRAPANGAMTGSYFYRDDLRFTCDVGYYLVGASRIWCQADGTWSDNVPVCSVVKCPMLKAPADGTMTGTNSYGDTVQFTCDSDCQRVGAATVTCQADGRWTDSVPICTASTDVQVPCPVLTAPEDGTMTGHKYFFYDAASFREYLPQGQSSCKAFHEDVEFTCHQGYELTGATRITCQADGTWSDSVPTCTVVQCPALTTPADGTITGSNLQRDVVSFGCDTGYDLVGPPSVTCKPDGAWSDVPPDCTVVRCPPLEAPTNGKMTGSNSYQDVIEFTCDVGHTLMGAQNVICQADARWSDIAPVCKVVQCPMLTPPSNGAMRGSDDSFDSVVDFTCYPGHNLFGATNTTCQEDGAWSERTPTCAIVQCPMPTAPEHGEMTGSNSYRDVLHFTCKTGYNLVGASDITCLSDTSWSDNTPNCTVVLCPQLTPPLRGSMTGSNSYQDVQHFTCEIGYNLVGSAERVCQADGTWSGSFPTCTIAQCQELAVPENGTMRGCNSYQNVSRFTCNPGYALTGEASLTCQADSSWSENAPVCTGVNDFSLECKM
ncbi:sushi, von Willebrand factor type A, EGF and pentraxin domain-containing protein 1-like [Branchiostoma floridae x Branchiostoma japonicum]